MSSSTDMTDPARIQRIAAMKLITDEDLAAVGLERCGDNSCVFGAPGGMATNGGCRCDDRNEAERWAVSARHAFKRAVMLARNIAADRRRLSEREAELLRMLANADTATLDTRREVAVSQAVAPLESVAVVWRDEDGSARAIVSGIKLLVYRCGQWRWEVSIFDGLIDRWCDGGEPMCVGLPTIDAAKAAAIAAARAWRDSIRL